jgi:hypothetical protein
MTTTTSSIGYKATVSSARTVLTPSPHAPFTSFDEHGLVLDLERIRNEKNYAYRQRLLETVARRANSTYRGLVNAITRELGLSLFKSVWINPKLDSSGSFIATDPYIKFDGTYLYLYSDYANGTLDATIDRYEPGGAFEHYFRLTNRVNLTANFEAGVHPGVDLYTRSMTILNQSNRGEVELEAAKGSTKFRLDKWPACQNTVFFSDRSIYKVEVSTLAAVTAKGDYHIDYMKGIVTSYLPPLPGTSIRYKYHQYPFVAWASPVILNDVNNDNFMVKMFEQVLQDDGTYAHGVPTTLGKDIINELLTVYPMYWGS